MELRNIEHLWDISLTRRTACIANIRHRVSSKGNSVEFGCTARNEPVKEDFIPCDPTNYFMLFSQLPR